jgi:hypothetical protein
MQDSTLVHVGNASSVLIATGVFTFGLALALGGSLTVMGWIIAGSFLVGGAAQIALFGANYVPGLVNKAKDKVQSFKKDEKHQKKSA